MNNWIKSFVIGFAILLVVSCAPKQGVPKGFDETRVHETLDQIVQLLSARDYDEVVKLFAPIMSNSIDAEGLSQSLNPRFDTLGAFDKIESKTIISEKLKDVGDVAVAIVTCKYANKKATYTITLDKNYQICGLYVK